jgi:uncharacterized protein YqeY
MLQQKIREDMQTALKARSMLVADTLRMLMSAMTNEMKKGGRMLVEGLPDDEVMSLIRREVKKRNEAAVAFEGAGRSDSAMKERSEGRILLAYLPAQMSEEDVRAAVLKKQEDLGIKDKSGAGILMGRVMKDLTGKADGTSVKKVVDSLFVE